MAEKVINGVNIKKHITSGDTNRKMGLDISEDGLLAYITIEYEENKPDPATGQIQELKYFNSGEIRESLAKAGITYGIIDESVIKCSTSKTIQNIQIAEGLRAIDDKEDIVDIKFQKKDTDSKFSTDDTGRVDYRNVGQVTAVVSGNVLANLIIGEEGKDGIDIYGKAIVRKKKKRIMIKAGEGCILKDGNTIEALIDGEPYVKNNVFYVYGVHTLNKDVSLETGDIIFIGDVKIMGSVKEGMKVDAGNSIFIEGNTENSTISAKGDISINGNSIMTTINAGGKDMKIYKYIGILEEARDLLNLLMDAMMAIKQNNLVGGKVADGEMIKVLMETKFTELPKRCWGILRESFDASNGEVDLLAEIIRGKLIGMAPLQIKHFSELDDIINMINERIEELVTTLTLPVNVKVGYCQDCNIQSSGDITVVGTGEYVSTLIADKGIFFVREGSIARGGILKANTEINCKVVGSLGGVKTKLVVGKQGHIRIGVAYQNTIVSVGGREFVIDAPSTNVHAYMVDRELIVDKFKK